MKTAVIYARYSSNSQTEQSIEGQLRVCNDYALRNDIIILEGLDLSAVPDGRYVLVCEPIKIKGADAAPCRAILLKDIMLYWQILEIKGEKDEK